MDANKVWNLKAGKLERFYWNGKVVYYLNNQLIPSDKAIHLIMLEAPND